MSIREQIENSYAAYAERDLEKALLPFAQDVVFNWCVDDSSSKYSGASQGVQAMQERLGSLASDFDYQNVKLLQLIVDGESAATRVDMHLVHRATGRAIICHSAQFWKFEGGKCVELIEYYDTGLISSMAG